MLANLERPAARAPGLRQVFADFGLTYFANGLIGFIFSATGPVAIILSVGTRGGLSQAELASWMWALGIGIAICSVGPSLWLRQPVMIAWSTPGAAVLAGAGAAATAAGSGFDMAHAIGAFMVSAALIVLCGVTGWFERVMNRIPMAIASALLAGVLARFGMQAFTAAQTQLGLVLVMLVTYLLCRQLWPRYAVPLTLVAAVAWVAPKGQLRWSAVPLDLATPQFTMPAFSLQAVLSLALPLFVVTMASQNLPGVAAIRTAGYPMRISPIISLTGVVTLLLAPFGAFALNLSAITAAICMGEQAHPDPAKRYTAAVACGLMYGLIGIFGAAVSGLLLAFPTELVAAIAGLALLGSIGGGLAVAVAQEDHREAAVITFLVTLSGVSLWGIGSAFWGVLAGALALGVQQGAARLK